MYDPSSKSSNEKTSGLCSQEAEVTMKLLYSVSCDRKAWMGKVDHLKFFFHYYCIQN